MKIETLNFTAMNDRERFEKILIYTNLNVRQLGIHLGLKQIQSLYDLKNGKISMPKNIAYKIKEKFQDLNLSWILAGEGEMLKPQVSQTITTNNGLAVANNGGSINYHHANHDANGAGAVEEVPVIPRYIYEETDVDAFEYINENDVPTSPKVKQFPNFDAYVNVYSDEMSPEINKGDKIAITPYEIGMERKVIDGRAYIIDTKYNGMMLRKLYKEDNGFRAESPNPAYRAEFIEYDEVIRVFRIVGLIRTNI